MASQVTEVERHLEGAGSPGGIDGSAGGTHVVTKRLPGDLGGPET